MDFIAVIGVDCLLLVLEYLDPHHLAILARVNSFFKSLVDSDVRLGLLELQPQSDIRHSSWIYDVFIREYYADNILITNFSLPQTLWMKLCQRTFQLQRLENQRSKYSSWKELYIRYSKHFGNWFDY